MKDLKTKLGLMTKLLQSDIKVSRPSELSNKIYKVMVDDNFHYMDEDERYQHGIYNNREEAIQVCEGIVNKSLDDCYKTGMTAEELFDNYASFGEDPFIESDDPDCHFSARRYAEERSVKIANTKNRPA